LGPPIDRLSSRLPRRFPVGAKLWSRDTAARTGICAYSRATLSCRAGGGSMFRLTFPSRHRLQAYGTAADSLAFESRSALVLGGSNSLKFAEGVVSREADFSAFEGLPRIDPTIYDPPSCGCLHPQTHPGHEAEWPEANHECAPPQTGSVICSRLEGRGPFLLRCMRPQVVQRPPTAGLGGMAQPNRWAIAHRVALAVGVSE
jgi:hypothetical protein